MNHHMKFEKFDMKWDKMIKTSEMGFFWGGGEIMCKQKKPTFVQAGHKIMALFPSPRAFLRRKIEIF